MSTRILIVDLDDSIREELPSRLIRLGHSVLTADHVADALRLLRLTSPHLIILDGEMWLYSLMTLRQHSNTPLILLKANDEVREHVAALQLGADDVVIKPFSVRELEARVRAVLRRVNRHSDVVLDLDGERAAQGLILGELHLDFQRRQAFRGQQRIRLTDLEMKLLEVLISHAGETLTRRELVHTVWGYDSEFISMRRLVDSAVSRLRAKLEVDADDPELILTIRGVGYMFRRLHHDSDASNENEVDGVADLEAWRARQWGLPPP
jgi:OmpR family response regulator RpaB